MPMKVITMPVERRVGLAGRHIVTCGTPAAEPKEALVTGNGILLLSTMGDPACDHLVLYREELASPQWAEPPKAPLIADKLGEVRRLILEGKYVEAAKLASETAAESGTPETLASNPPHPAMSMKLIQPVREAKDFLFTLNMRTSLITTRWEDMDGLYKREMFVSRADGIAVLRVTAPAGRLNLILKGEPPEIRILKNRVLSCNDVPGGVDKYYTGEPIPPKIVVRHTKNGILLSGVYAYQKGGFSVAVRAVVEGGTMYADEDGLHVKDGDSAIFLMNARRNYNIQPENDDERLMDELLDIDPDFDKLLARHVAIHQPMFDRVTVDLGGDPEDYLLTGVELKQKQFLSQTIVPAYMEMMIDRGRFFLLTECGKFPPIYGHVNININLQISCGNIGALPEMMESFFRWIEWQLPDARENAQRILGTRGFFIACHPDEESGRLYHFNEYYPHHYWISSSGWCLHPFLEYYQCTGDEDFLRNRMLPLYKELALLYEDFLSVRDENGKLMFIPSYSPENFPSNVPCMAVINATMDISVCREVLETLLTYAPKVGACTDEELSKWQKMLDDLPPYLFDTHGELKEWAREDLEERKDHRHASHLYGAYPSHEFQPELNPELYKAAFIANRMRAFGNESFHGVGHRALAAARLKDPWLVNMLLRFTLESGFVNDNFTTVHNPYHKFVFPDAQGALPTIFMESVFYSRPGFIEVLPALPMDSFPKGSVKGMWARTFAIVDELTWDLDKGIISLCITSRVDQEITACCRLAFENFECEGASYQPGLAEIYRQVYLTSGETAVLRWVGVHQK